MEYLELEQKNITIASVETLEWGFKVSDSQNLKYNISQYKKGTQDQTVAYTSLIALNKNGLGMTKCFKFVTVPNSQGGKSRYVRIIGEPEEETQAISVPTNEPVIQVEEKPNWDDINFGKCKHQFLLEAFKGILKRTTSLSEMTKIDIEAAEKIAEQWAEMSMRILKNGDMPTGEEPENQPPF